jgi:hypothetical protein
MNNKPQNPSAFARPFSMDAYGDHETPQDAQEGMTLRDYFAAAAIQPLLVAATPGYTFEDGSTVAQNLAKDAYLVADAMLKAREA